MKTFCISLLICASYCLSSVRAQNSQTDSAFWYFEQGRRYAIMDKAEETLKMYDQAYLLYEQKQTWDSCILSLVRAFGVTAGNRDNKSIQRRLTRAKQLANSHFSPTHPIWGDILALEGYSYMLAKDYSGAEDLFNKSLSIRYEAFGEQHSAIVDAYKNLGFIYIYSNQFPKADEAYRQALQFSKSVAMDSLDLAVFYAEAGYAYIHLMNSELSSDLLRKAQKILDQSIQSNDPYYLQGSIMFGIGTNLRRNRHLSQAIPYLERALSIKRSVLDPDHLHLLEIYTDIGFCYWFQAEYDQGLKYLHRSWEIGVKNYGKDSPRVAESYGVLGHSYFSIRDYDRAKEFLSYAIELAEKYKAQRADPKHSYYLGVMGMIHADMGEYEESKVYFERAIDIADNSPDRHSPPGIYQMAQIYENYGYTFFLAGEYEEAQKRFEKAMEFTRTYSSPGDPDIANIWYTYAMVALATHQHEKGFSYLETSMSMLLPQLSYPPFDIRAEDIPRAQGIENLISTCLNVTAALFFDRYKTDSQTVDLYKAWQMQSSTLATLDAFQRERIDEASQITFHRDVGFLYENALEMLHELYLHTDSTKYIELAFQVAERTRANVLKQAFLQSKSKQVGGLPLEIQQEEQSFKDSILSIQQQLDMLSGEQTDKVLELQKLQFATTLAYQDFLQQVQQSYPAYYKLIHNFEGKSIPDIQESILDDSKALIEFYFTNDQMLTLLIRSDSSFFYNQMIPDNFQDQISSLRQLISKDQADNDSLLHLTDKLSSELGQSLIRPLQDKLSQTTQLIIVPDDVLGFLPFDILITSRDSVDDSPQYLLQTHQISYAFSANLLLEMMQTDHSGSLDIDLLAMTPSFPVPVGEEGKPGASIERDRYFPLPFSKMEGTFLHQTFHGTLLQDSLASKEQFQTLAPRSRIIHLATHAKAFAKDSRFSHIAFSPKNNIQDQDHHLNVPEIYAMDLPADMVVLSACETGLGELKRGEGIISLGRAFTYAGAKSIISTLWSVNDQSTSELMISFYGYLDQGMSKDAALRQAKLDYLDSHDAQLSHPYYWAAPIAIGDMSPVRLRSYGSFWWIGLLLLGLLIGLYSLWKKRNSS